VRDRPRTDGQKPQLRDGSAGERQRPCHHVVGSDEFLAVGRTYERASGSTDPELKAQPGRQPGADGAPCRTR